MPLTANAMIVTAQPEASEAGARVLMRGGNAVDAAMAAALVQGVVDPQMCGIAGFGSLQIYDPKGAHTCIDFHGKVHPDQFWWHYDLGDVRQRPFSQIWMDQWFGVFGGCQLEFQLLFAGLQGEKFVF